MLSLPFLITIVAVVVIIFLSIKLNTSRQKYIAAKEQKSLLIESINDGIIVIDYQGNIKSINASCCRLLGVQDKTSVQIQPIASILPLENKNNEAISFDKRPENETASPENETEDIYFYQPPDELLDKRTLKIKVNLLDSNDIHSDKLITIEDRTEVEEIERLKIDFVTIASHQLRTPLSAIRWFSEMMLSGDSGKLNKDQTEFLKNIHGSTERMIGLVNALLNISRIESGHIGMSLKPTNLEDLIAQSLKELDSDIKDKKHTIAVKIQKDLPVLSVDPQLIRQVYDNLLGNAVTYTPGGGDISVDVSEKDNMILTKITDSGYGVPEKCKDHIFKKFYRGENIVKIQTDGNGLGLFLVRAIVESSGGTVWFESTEDNGSTFWFTLPVSSGKAKLIQDL